MGKWEKLAIGENWDCFTRGPSEAIPSGPTVSMHDRSKLGESQKEGSEAIKEAGLGVRGKENLFRLKEIKRIFVNLN